MPLSSDVNFQSAYELDNDCITIVQSYIVSYGFSSDAIKGNVFKRKSGIDENFNEKPLEDIDYVPNGSFGACANGFFG